MSAKERTAIRRVGTEDARRSRAQQGLPEGIEDPAEVALLAAILSDTHAPAPSSEAPAMRGTHGHKPTGGGDVIATCLRRSQLRVAFFIKDV